MLLWIPTTVVRSLNDIWIRVRTSLIRNSLWFEIESTYDSQMSESRFTYLWFLIRFDFDSQVNHDSRVNHDLRRMKIKPNKKSKVGESWFTQLRIIGWFDFESKANQSESRIKLVRALGQLFWYYKIWFSAKHLILIIFYLFCDKNTVWSSLSLKEWVKRAE